MAKKKKAPTKRPKRSRRRRRIKSLFNIKIFLVLGVAFVLFYSHLHLQVTNRFEQRKWNLPSRVYSDSYPLYSGKVATTSEIDEKLMGLNYRPVSGQPKHPGEYAKSGVTYSIYLHDFDYPHEKFKGFLTTFSIVNNRIENLKNATKGEKLALVNLEPELVASIFDENMEDRTVVPLTKIPQHLQDAVIAIEDERFYHHFGVDPIAIARALLADIRAMGLVQGGSTLTQQLVKNFFLHNRKTFTRKLSEFFMAIIMEFNYSKEEILESYLNEIYFGQRGAASISGVEEASLYYFSKHAEQLKPAESALLAGLIRSPGNYSPFKNPDRARERRNLVLTRLKENKKLSDKEYANAITAELPKQPKNKITSAPYFVEFVKAELKDNFSEDILTTEGLRIFTTLEMNHQRAAETAVKTWLDKLEKDFPKLKANAEKGLQLQGSLVAVQPGTGFILAYVAGRDYGKVQFDHLRQAKRQPGSTFKPFVYLTALNRAASVAFTPSSILKDDAISFDNGGIPWKPENYDHAYHGDVRLRTALEKSYNAATVWLGEQIGFDAVVETAEKAGITSELKAYPSLVLGAFEVTPMELAMAYSVFPGQGVKADPIVIRRVVTPDGEVLEKKSVGLKPVFDADTIYLMNRLLMGVVDNGTAASARSRGFKTLAAGKTGTTSDARDAWFVGYTPEILALSWVGYDDNSQTGLSGASGALPIWTEFMKKAAAGRSYTDFQPTSHIVIVTIDAETGLLWEPSCGTPLSEYFIEGTEPFEYCSVVTDDSYEYEDE